MAGSKDKNGGDDGDKPKDNGDKAVKNKASPHRPTPPQSTRGQESLMSSQGACALPPGNSARMNETQPKSQFLDNLPASSRDITSQQYQSAIGCSTTGQGPILPGQLGDTSQDISLNDHITRQTSSPSSAMAASGSSSSIPLTSPHLTPALPSHQSPLQMNIPPSLSLDRMNNTDIPVGMAEAQISFQEVPPSVSLPHALYPIENPHSTMPFSTNTNMTRSSSIEDCTTASNISVHNIQGSAEMSARPVSPEGATAQTTAASILSHSESRQSLKSVISPDCQVRKLPKSILKFISVEMKTSWEDLVEHYGWNFHETQNFLAQHPNDVFLALLKEAPFQTYTLSRFQEDLKLLPREDLLLDLDEKIQIHNAEIP